MLSILNYQLIYNLVAMKSSLVIKSRMWCLIADGHSGPKFKVFLWPVRWIVVRNPVLKFEIRDQMTSSDPIVMSDS